MRASWERHGATVMDRVAVEYPDRYLGIAAHLIPKEVTATIEAGSGVLDLECMAILQAIKDQQTIAVSWSSSGMLSELTAPSGLSRPRTDPRKFVNRPVLFARG